ncbi:MAG: hypothetical protein LUQ38_11230 [Methanotrichaceae archaeon]|nr:hypothetical protein [Methanotrichaceae archaeon]
MDISLNEDDIAYLLGKSGTVAIAKTKGKNFYLDSQIEEIVLFTEPDDMLVASSFSVGEKIRRGLKCTLFQIRELGAPLLVLPKDHPASRRLRIVVSIGSRIRLSCKIQPGTHPEQDILCGSEEFHGLEIFAKPQGAEIEAFQGEILTDKL